MVPLIRQYILFSNNKLATTVELVKENFFIYERFFTIQLKLKDNMDPITMNPDKLKRSLQRFQYEKPTQVTRGLRASEGDDNTRMTDSENGEETPLIQPVVEIATKKPAGVKVANDPMPYEGLSGVREPKKRSHIIKTPPQQNTQSQGSHDNSRSGLIRQRSVDLDYKVPVRRGQKSIPSAEPEPQEDLMEQLRASEKINRRLNGKK